MKYRFIIWLLYMIIGLNQGVKAQPYRSIFGSITTDWSIIPFGACDFVVSRDVSSAGDTMINGQVYRTIPHYGYLREDSLAGKVWFLDSLGQQEHLVMNLGLNVGDTFLINDFDSSWPFVVDSVYYSMGIRNVRLTAGIDICSYHQPLLFVEGSGPNAGFHYQGFLNGSGLPCYMLCHYKNGIRVLGNLMFGDSCSVYEVGVDNQAPDDSKLRVWPNPSPGFIWIYTGNCGTGAHIKVYDPSGRCLSVIAVEPDTELNIAPGGAGIYLISLQSPGNLPITRKILVFPDRR